jgi:hypothetical protein
MEVVNNIIRSIKQKPLMYLRKKSLSYLRAYIEGYMARQFEVDNDYNTVFSGFGDFVIKYFDANIIQGWDKVIEFYTENEEEAFDKFFEIYDEYLLYISSDDEIYPLGTTVFKQEYRNVMVRHYTNHGNPKRCTNPHDHEIVWYPDNTFSYKPPINYYGDVPKL